jgi:hypothetical protein
MVGGQIVAIIELISVKVFPPVHMKAFLVLRAIAITFAVTTQRVL